MEGKRIFVGDYNLVLNCKLDRKNEKQTVFNNKNAAQVINEYIKDTFMTDVWRERNADAQKITYIRKKPFSGSRIDFCLTEKSITGWIKRSEIKLGFKTDHDRLEIEIEPKYTKQGKGIWKLNNRLLYEAEYVQEIKGIVEKIEQESSHVNKSEKWEMTKLKIIQGSQIYAKNRAKNRNFGN